MITDGSPNECHSKLHPSIHLKSFLSPETFKDGNYFCDGGSERGFGFSTNNCSGNSYTGVNVRSQVDPKRYGLYDYLGNICNTPAVSKVAKFVYENHINHIGKQSNTKPYSPKRSVSTGEVMDLYHDYNENDECRGRYGGPAPGMPTIRDFLSDTVQFSKTLN